MSVNADQIAADGRCGWENADTIMRMEKNADNKKGNMKKTRNADGKKKKRNKQTKERNLAFKSLSHGWTLQFHTERDANSWHSYFVHCNSFH